MGFKADEMSREHRMKGLVCHAEEGDSRAVGPGNEERVSDKTE